MTERRICACRRPLTEAELFRAHGAPGPQAADHDEPHLLEAPQRAQKPEPAPIHVQMQVEALQARYARRRSPGEILAQLADQEHRLKVGGRK